jgi:hypothetical protein
VSGNPLGKLRGCLNRAPRAALHMLDSEAEALWHAEIDIASGAAKGERPERRCHTDLFERLRGEPSLNFT